MTASANVGQASDSVGSPRSEPPTRDECERIRRLYQAWEDEPDQLTQAALVVSVPRLLARIEWLEALLKEKAQT